MHGRFPLRLRPGYYHSPRPNYHGHHGGVYYRLGGHDLGYYVGLNGHYVGHYELDLGLGHHELDLGPHQWQLNVGWAARQNPR